MKSIVINSSQLGTHCWSAFRFGNSCYQCRAYNHCKYSERVSNKEYDLLQADIYHKTEILASAERKLREFIE